MRRGVNFFSGIVLGSALLVAGGDIEPVIPSDQAQNGGFYLGAGLGYQRTYSTHHSWVNYTEGQDTTRSIEGITGYRFNRYISIEGRVSQTVLEEDYADVLSYTLYLKPSFPLTESFTIYGLLGYGIVKVKGANGDVPSANPGKTIINKGSFAWGFGLDYAITKKWSIFLDYTSLMHNRTISPQPFYAYETRKWNKISDDSLNVGILYRF